MSRNKKYSNKLKLKVVGEYLAGAGGYKYLSKEYNIKYESDVRKWVHQYQSLGINGLLRARNYQKYSLELKLEAIKLHMNSEMSLKEISKKLGIKEPSLISSWKKTLKKSGVAGLIRKQGRPSMKDNNKRNEDIKESKNPKKLNSLTEDEKDLRIKELEYELRLAKIKNEYLEMLRSLGQEETKTKQESSTNSGTNTN